MVVRVTRNGRGIVSDGCKSHDIVFGIFVEVPCRNKQVILLRTCEYMIQHLQRTQLMQMKQNYRTCQEVGDSMG